MFPIKLKDGDFEASYCSHRSAIKILQRWISNNPFYHLPMLIPQKCLKNNSVWSNRMAHYWDIQTWLLAVFSIERISSASEYLHHSSGNVLHEHINCFFIDLTLMLMPWRFSKVPKFMWEHLTNVQPLWVLFVKCVPAHMTCILWSRDGARHEISFLNLWTNTMVSKSGVAYLSGQTSRREISGSRIGDSRATKHVTKPIT